MTLFDVKSVTAAVGELVFIDKNGVILDVAEIDGVFEDMLRNLHLHVTRDGTGGCQPKNH